MSTHIQAAAAAAAAAIKPTWEAHNRISTDACIRHVSPDAVDDGAVSRCCVAACHLPQDIIVTRLERDVEELTQLWQLCACAHQPV
jgi:hypothetical protein